MDQKYLTINIGSRSKKYGLFDAGGILLESLHFEDEHYRDPAPENYFTNVTAAGVRIVAPGEYFLTHRPIDDAYLQKLRGAAELAPLHVAPTLAEIELIKKNYPSLPLYGLSDSAFYAARPRVSKLYGLPQADAAHSEIYRFGYHGLSVESVVTKLKEQTGINQQRVIICHLGGGVSVVALRGGAVVETSMGFTPLEGPVMSSRVGRIDAGAVLALLRAKNCPAAELEGYFNNLCGLKGISGRSDSVRELLKLEGAGDADARLALELFVWTVKKEIGAALALLGGLDILIFTATIGERSAPMRERIIAGLEELALVLDLAKNQSVPDPVGEQPLWLESASSRTKIGVIASAEGRQMCAILQKS